MTRKELKDLADAIARSERVHWHDIYLIVRHLESTTPHGWCHSCGRELSEDAVEKGEGYCFRCGGKHF